MNKDTVYTLIMNWCKEFVSKDFNHGDMEDNVSLIGFDSIGVVEFCEYLEDKLGIEIDHEWVWGCETLKMLSAQLEKERV